MFSSKKRLLKMPCSRCMDVCCGSQVQIVLFSSIIEKRRNSRLLMSLLVVIYRCNSSVPVTNSLAQIKWFWKLQPNVRCDATNRRTLVDVILRCFEFNNCIVRLFFNLNKKYMKRRGFLYLLSGIACIVVKTIPQTSFEFSRGNITVDIQSSSLLS